MSSLAIDDKKISFSNQLLVVFLFIAAILPTWLKNFLTGVALLPYTASVLIRWFGW
jgi:hypothetical protein